MSLKHKLKVLCANNDITLLDIMKAYNKRYDKSMVSATFYKMINNDNIKWNTLADMLDSIGYEIVFRRKRDVDQWKYFSKLNWIQLIEAADVYDICWFSSNFRCAASGLQCSQWDYNEINVQVSPACAGMIPTIYKCAIINTSEPRMRRDDSLIDSHISIIDKYSDYNILSTIFISYLTWSQ